MFREYEHAPESTRPTADEEYTDRDLAERLRLEVDELWLLAGRDWLPVTPSDIESPVDWWVAGDPPQVMVGVGREDLDCWVARPRGYWQYGLRYEPADARALGDGWRQELPQALQDIARSRRRVFRWCRYCRQLMPPEYRHGVGICRSCAEVVLDVVH